MDHETLRETIMPPRYCKLKCVFKMAIVLSSVMMLGSFFFLNSNSNTSSEGLSLVYDIVDESAVDGLNSEDGLLDKQQGMDKGDSLPDLSKEKDEVRNREEPLDRQSIVKGELQNRNYVKKSQNGATGIKNAEPEKYRKIPKYTWVTTNGNNVHSKLKEFGEFVTSKRQNIRAKNFTKIEEFEHYTPVYEGDTGFFQKILAIKKAKLYFLPWTHNIEKWLNMDFKAKQDIVSPLLPVKEYHPTFLSRQFIAKEFGNDTGRATSVIPNSVPLRSQASLSKKINTFFFGYHGMTPHRPRFRLIMDLLGGWNLTKDCTGRICTGFPDMLTYMIVLQADKYRINVGTNGRIHIPDTKQRIVMSCCYENYTKPKYVNKPHVFVDRLFDMTQNKIRATHHGLVESLTKLALFAPFLRQNPDIHLHFTSNGYSKVLLPIVTETLNLKNPILMHEFNEIEANTVYVPPGMHCFRGGDLMSVQMTSHFFNRWTEQKFQGNTTRDTVIILKRSSRHIINYNALYRIVESNVKQTHGKLHLYEFYDKNLPPVSVMMQLFYRAQAIIGVHGAGLTNMIFARPGTHLVEIMCPSMNPVFKEMAYKLGLYYYPSLSVGKNNCFYDGPLANVAEIQDITSVIFENIKRKFTK